MHHFSKILKLLSKLTNMFQLVKLIIPLSFLLVNGDIDSDKQAACDRRVKIVAASKTLKPGEFYIFEEWKAWLYDAGERMILDHYDIEETIRSKSPDDPILRASSYIDCRSPEKLIFRSGRIITRKTSFKFKDIQNFSAWSSIETDELRKQNQKAENTKTEGVIETRGTACVSKASKSYEFTHNYIRPKRFRHCEGFRHEKRCTFSETWTIYSPFDIEEPIKEPNSFPEALAYQFEIDQTNPAALFVFDDTIFYAVSEDGHWTTKQVSVKQVFGCESSLWLWVTILIVGLAMVIIPVMVFAIIIFLIVIRHKDSHEENETSTVATSTTTKAPSEIVNQTK